MNDNIHTLTHGHCKIKSMLQIMNHEKLLNKLYYEDLNFIGVNPLYELAKNHDKTITKEFVRKWLKNQSTQQQTTPSVRKYSAQSPNDHVRKYRAQLPG